MADDEEETPVAPPQPVLHTDNVSSFLDLQSEFIKRRDAAIAGRQTQSPLEFVHRSTRNNILAISKEEKKTKTEVATQRTQRIRQNEEAIRKEEQQRAKQLQILQKKAAIYDRMAKGERLVYEDGKEAEFLVDFHAKKRELEDEERNKPSSSSAAAWDENGDESLRPESPPLIVHYDHSEDKGRVFGASHVPLPTMDEDAREQKIKELKTMSEETHRIRAKNKRQKSEEEAEERRRLNRVRARIGLEPIPSSDEEDNIANEPPEVAGIPLPPAPSAIEGGGADAKAVAGPAEKRPRRLGVREWDRGKIGCMRWVEEQRDEREDEFAPPSFYYEGEKSRKKRNL
uniref:Uncharacterized protein n=1 Tax=Globodera rostochiensis TaxID=31243 RepID=A0A914HH15_GLORO